MNILFLCTSNKNRSKTAEDFYRVSCKHHEFKSAGLSQKYCLRYGSTLCSIEMLSWADIVFVMQEFHKKRIAEHGGESYLKKIEVLHIQDIYSYMQLELLEKLRSHEKLQFLLTSD